MLSQGDKIVSATKIYTFLSIQLILVIKGAHILAVDECRSKVIGPCVSPERDLIKRLDERVRI